jgi:hypothetical protein
LDPSNPVATFKSARGTINFDVIRVGGQFNLSSDAGVSRVLIDGLTNFTGTGVGLASVGSPVQAALAARAAAARAGGGNLDVVARFDKQVAAQREVGSSSSVKVSMVGDSSVDCATDGNSSKTECK